MLYIMYRLIFDVIIGTRIDAACLMCWETLFTPRICAGSFYMLWQVPVSVNRKLDSLSCGWIRKKNTQNRRKIVHFNPSCACPAYGADFRFAPNQWETALLSNVSHWLGASLKSALCIYIQVPNLVIFVPADALVPNGAQLPAISPFNDHVTSFEMGETAVEVESDSMCD